ncbi:MAG TPA: Fe-S oxidoreductase [Elusimicrobia bacterium]|nr:MAG: Fe-S oxidoreductase [Elusimicrobia bacterium RIFOXYA12_FULL_49_49]OGS14890.1 MAG: Fe-S oxidoreductase [Elusimicrobia bacterium RIFOXYA2_FULL_47_53]OGS26479.1 MAG: Fe-S oxidoreductase [Elusimicrobia bacterium RIFOXYB12_FULL_50_12]OGS29858.1 MAG: Fe-S oxidoreductase [Elusimicrobia bacterium RIFOXYB2_FULL_46_23]HBU69801.1 Fe-S oxidoreductase [Elusimicrobiota bacterium]
MSGLKPKQRQYLLQRFGKNVSFDRLERKLYGHDISAMPKLFKPLLGDTTPDAVVQPRSEDDLIELVKWADANRIPLTPRGKASSGYGGVLPVKNGIVIDFFRMNKVLSVNPETLEATVQAGVVWEKLDKELGSKGLTLRLYPTSYPASTVGGWLAQGGAGIGSYEYGWFKDNVVSARVVSADGSVKAFKGKEIALISEAEGMTGIISSVTVKVQKNEELEVVALGCPDAHSMQKAVSHVIETKMPVWSLAFINPKMAELKNKSPHMEHFGHEVGEHIDLPKSYIILLTYRAKDKNNIIKQIPDIIKASGASQLGEHIARHEWENRFKPMVVKRLGPSLVPSEIVVPVEALGKVLSEIEKKVTQPLVKEGVIVLNGMHGKPEAVILGFIPSDQRKFGYNLVFALVLSIVKIAEKYGGRAYSTGIYFVRHAAKLLGKERLEEIKKYKKQADPHGIFNPGKVYEPNLMSLALAMGGLFEPFSRPFGNFVVTEIGERAKKPVRGIPADVAWYAYSCSQCGNCVDTCTQFSERGWESQSPRGKWFWLKEYMEGREKWDQKIVDSFLVCTTCELCDTRCSACLPVEPSWMKLRGKLVNEDKWMPFPPFEMMSAALVGQGNIWAGYRKNRADWFPADLKEKYGPGRKSKSVYFAGCTASYVEHDIGIASVRLLDKAGVDFTFLGERESCCGTPMLASGKWDVFSATMKKNIKSVQDAGADTVISSCPACDMMWRHVYPAWAKKEGIEFNIKARHYSEVLAEKIKSGEFKFPANDNKPVTVTWHDSCHMGRASGVFEPPRELIKAIPNVNFVEMKSNREEGKCCGSVLTLIKEPDVAGDIGKSRLEEAVDASAQKVLALCPCCEFQLRVSADSKKVPVEVVDLASFAASALGYKLPDPNPEVKAQWAVFEAMIALMTPRGFADLMQTMWPELVDAMPFGMGPMMRLMGKIPGALNLMKPMFPLLFPKLLPMMMPKVMPVMLSRVAQRVPMPDYMREQMPVLMPQVMDNLMPHMIKDVVPLVTPGMIKYLQNK